MGAWLHRWALFVPVSIAVVFTMIASEAFDPRLMWDAAGITQ
jgi:uncharacterized paraquat-inducible protein A